MQPLTLHDCSTVMPLLPLQQAVLPDELQQPPWQLAAQQLPRLQLCVCV
jgi:hypothetical protein